MSTFMNGAQLIYSVCLGGGVELATLRAVVAEWLPRTNLTAPPLCICVQGDSWEICMPRSTGLRAVNDLEARLRTRMPAASVAVMALTMSPMRTIETVDLRLS
jgi:hypothetical protein